MTKFEYHRRWAIVHISLAMLNLVALIGLLASVVNIDTTVFAGSLLSAFTLGVSVAAAIANAIAMDRS